VYFQTVSFFKIFYGSLPQDHPTVGRKQCLPQCLCRHNAENSGTGTGTVTTKTSFAVPILALWGNINLRVLVTIETWDIEKMYRCMNRLN